MKILIINLHSALNLGDDAIMHVTLGALKKRFPNAVITAAANDPDSWRKYKDIEIVESLCNWVADCRLGKFRNKIILMPIYLFLIAFAALLYRFSNYQLFFGSSKKRQLQNAYYDADLVLSCGGGNYYAHQTFSPALIWHLFSLAFAIILGKRTIMLPQSIGPIEGKIQRSFASRIIARVDTIMVREPQSLFFVKNVLRVPGNIVLLPDLAFGLPMLESEKATTSLNRSSQINIGITAIDRGAQQQRYTQQREYEDSIVNLLLKTIEDHNAYIHIIVQCSGPSPDQDDRIIALRLFNKLSQRTSRVRLLDPFQDALQIQAAFQSMDLVIGTRMHTGILAFSCSKPVLMIGYQPKALGVMQSMGLSNYYLDIELVNKDDLYALTKELLDSKETIHNQVKKRYSESHIQLVEWLAFL